MQQEKNDVSERKNKDYKGNKEETFALDQNFMQKY